MPAVAYPHIEIRNGVAFIEGTRHKVKLLALEHLARGWEAPELQENFPHLSLAQIHSALAYYHDHRAEMDAEMEADRRFVAEMRRDHRDDNEFLKKKLQEARKPR
jgi:uncharacterized protein (DUF433 family)